MAKRDSLYGENEQSMAEHRLSEDDTRAKLIDPALRDAGWREEYIRRAFPFTDGRKVGGNRRGSRKVADYLLIMQNVNLAFIEAKRVDLEATAGLLGAFLGLHEEIHRVG